MNLEAALRYLKEVATAINMDVTVRYAHELGSKGKYSCLRNSTIKTKI